MEAALLYPSPPSQVEGKGEEKKEKEKKKEEKKKPWIKKVIKKIPQGELLPRLPKMFFAQSAEIEARGGAVAVKIMESYEWLGDSTIRALEGARSGGAPVREGSGKAGTVWRVTYKGADYAMKISFQNKDLVPFGVGEGMIGAYLAAPRLDPDRQRELAVPMYRVEDPDKLDFDPFLHVADYYGVLVLQIKGVAKSLGALFGAKNVEWKPIFEHLKAEEKKAMKGTDPESSYVLIQILEYFSGGSLREWAFDSAMSSAPGSRTPNWGPGWDRRHAAMMHYMKLVFFQISLTVVHLRHLGFNHGDLHDANLLLRPITRKSASAIYSRAPGAYTLLDAEKDLAPPFAGFHPDMFPVVAMADLGGSIIGTFSAAAGKIMVAHQAHDLHKMSMWLLWLVASTAHPPMNTIALGKLSDEDFWSEARFYTRAFHDLYSFCATVRRFVIEPIDAPELFWGFKYPPTSAQYIEDILVIDWYIAKLKYYSDLWLGSFSRSSDFPGVSMNFHVARMSLQAGDYALRMIANKNEMLSAFGRRWSNPGVNSFYDGTNWTLANAIYARQEAMVEKDVIAPSGMINVAEELLPALTMTYNLVRPKFVEGDEKFWRKQPAPAKARGKARDDIRQRGKGDSTRRPLF